MSGRNRWTPGRDGYLVRASAPVCERRIDALRPPSKKCRRWRPVLGLEAAGQGAMTARLDGLPA